MKERAPELIARAAEGIRSLVRLERPDEPLHRGAGSAVEITLRRAFRVCGLGIRPFPVG